MPNKNKIGVLVAVLVVVVLAILVMGGEKKNVHLVSLSASTDKPSYSSGDEVTLSVGLTNAGKESVCLSNTALGNIKFVSVTRDGAPVETRTAPSYFLTSLSEMMKSKLLALPPGEKMDIAIVSSEDPGLHARTLDAMTASGTAGVATFYNIALPGTYKVDVAYEYPGEASPSCADVFKGMTNTATVSFVVTK